MKDGVDSENIYILIDNLCNLYVEERWTSSDSRSIADWLGLARD